MKAGAQIEKIDRQGILGLISSGCGVTLNPSETDLLDRCLMLTSSLWAGFVNGKFVCVWGLIPPTLMSEQAYLWLYTTKAVKEYEFLFIRNSQRAVETMLEEYPLIVGHAGADRPRTLRWLRWLGATFGEPDGKVIPFRIGKK